MSLEFDIKPVCPEKAMRIESCISRADSVKIT